MAKNNIGLLFWNNLTNKTRIFLILYYFRVFLLLYIWEKGGWSTDHLVCAYLLLIIIFSPFVGTSSHLLASPVSPPPFLSYNPHPFFSHDLSLLSFFFFSPFLPLSAFPSSLSLFLFSLFASLLCCLSLSSLSFSPFLCRF